MRVLKLTNLWLVFQVASRNINTTFVNKTQNFLTKITEGTFNYITSSVTYVSAFKFSLFFSMKNMWKSHKEPRNTKITTKYWYKHCYFCCKGKLFKTTIIWKFAKCKQSLVYVPTVIMVSGRRSYLM